MMKIFKKILLGLIVGSSSLSSLAASGSLGSIAEQITTPVLQASHLLQVICIICGIAFTLGSLLKYKAHRNNPQETPLSTPIMLLLFGLLLLALGILPGMLLKKTAF